MFYENKSNIYDNKKYRKLPTYWHNMRNAAKNN